QWPHSYTSMPVAGCILEHPRAWTGGWGVLGGQPTFPLRFKRWRNQRRRKHREPSNLAEEDRLQYIAIPYPTLCARKPVIPLATHRDKSLPFVGIVVIITSCYNKWHPLTVASILSRGYRAVVVVGILFA